MSERWTPHATVATVVEHNGRFLMVEELAHGSTPVLNQPAGHIEANESIVDAARRETLEETGWEVEPVALVGLYTYTAPANGVTYHRYCLQARAIRQIANATLDDGIIGPRWMTLAELEQSTQLRSPMVLTCVKDYMAGKRFPLDIIVEHP
ncbi:NUDIX hydrolase [Venatoribacter cucullus]|uniref:NUDIX hydrolase n=1 Tax=Venatoribacter cucullus TaxID=2661630 RepID=UPI001934E1E0|nr:NUDIX hydrolase [Venatoribacter cucullus]QQD21436.1 NUDIX domain-containing protein [Oceanospirillaceae bacterium ASx5O]UZK03696.1 NUDIX domain-containing protein [Venatoribacter cucullus]